MSAPVIHTRSSSMRRVDARWQELKRDNPSFYTDAWYEEEKRKLDNWRNVDVLHDRVNAWLESHRPRDDGPISKLWQGWEERWEARKKVNPGYYTNDRQRQELLQIRRRANHQDSRMKEAIERWERDNPLQLPLPVPLPLPAPAAVPMEDVAPPAAAAAAAPPLAVFTPEELRWNAILNETNLCERIYHERYLLNTSRYGKDPSKVPRDTTILNAVADIACMDNSKGWQAAVDQWMERHPVQTKEADETIQRELKANTCGRCESKGVSDAMIRCGHTLCGACMAWMYALPHNDRPMGWVDGTQMRVFRCGSCNVWGPLVPLTHALLRPLVVDDILRAAPRQ